MKKILFSLILVSFFISSQVAFGDSILYTFYADPDIPVYTGKISNKPIEEDIATFPYDTTDLPGDITAASISFEWGSTNINKLTKVDLYLNGTLIFDFGDYYNSLDNSQKKALKIALRKGETFPITINITDENALEALENGATLYLVGNPKFFSSLTLLDDITLSITDPEPNGDTNPVPEPTTMLLLGAGLIGLWGLRKRIRN